MTRNTQGEPWRDQNTPESERSLLLPWLELLDSMLPLLLLLMWLLMALALAVLTPAPNSASLWTSLPQDSRRHGDPSPGEGGGLLTSPGSAETVGIVRSIKPLRFWSKRTQPRNHDYDDDGDITLNALGEGNGPECQAGWGTTTKDKATKQKLRMLWIRVLQRRYVTCRTYR